MKRNKLLDRAIADYTKAIRLNPNFALTYNNRGGAYYYKKEYARAARTGRRLYSLTPIMPRRGLALKY